MMIICLLRLKIVHGRKDSLITIIIMEFKRIGEDMQITGVDQVAHFLKESNKILKVMPKIILNILVKLK